MLAVGHLLLQSFWANQAVFQLMMMAYNLFLLFKMDRGMKAEYRQQIRTFRLKYIFLRLPVSAENNGNGVQTWNPAIIEADPLDWTGTLEWDKIPFMERFGQPVEC